MIWAIVGIVGALVAWLYIRSLFPAYLNLGLQDLDEHVEGLYYYGYDEGWVTIWPRGTKKQLFAVRKRIRGKGQIALELEYPIEPWSERLRDRLATFVEERDLESTLIERAPNLHVQQIHCEDNTQLCATLCRHIASELATELNVPPRFVLDFDNVNQRGEMIGF